MRTAGKRGFTLVELLVALVIALVVVGAVYQFFIRQQRVYSVQDELVRIQQDARVAEDLIVRTIQQAGAYSPSTGTTIQLRGQVVLAASDHYLTIQGDDPLRSADLGVITEEEVVTFAVSKQKPSVVGAATDGVDDRATAGTKQVAVYFDQNRNKQVEAAEKFQVAIPLDLKGPPYSLYRVTPDQQNPTTTAKLHAEPIAANVENLVFRYYDQNGSPIPRDPATGAPLPPPYVLTDTQRAQIRSIEVEIGLRTSKVDAAYGVAYAPQAMTVASYDASGNPRASVPATLDHFRRRVFRTRVTPRNLSVNACGSILLSTNNGTPLCGETPTILATVQDREGKPVANAPITFSTSDGTLSVTSATTDASGNASTTLTYNGLSKSIAISASSVLDCSPLGPSRYTVINAIAVDYKPGASARVDVSAPSTAQVETCGSPVEWTFTATAFDACNNPVPPQAGVKFEAIEPGSPPGVPPVVFGKVNGAAFANFTDAGQTFTVRPSAPYPAARDAATGYFKQTVRATGTWLATPYIPAGPGWPVTVKPWPPVVIDRWSTGVTSVTHTDCPSPDVRDTFVVLDCQGNTIYNLGAGYAAEATLTSDPLSLAKYGKLFSNATSGNPLQILTGVGAGLFELIYKPPTCTLGPPKGTLYNPLLRLTLKNGASIVWPPAGAVPDPSKRTLNLESCADVQLTANPATMTECSGVTTVTVSGCNLANQTVRLTVTSNGGSGSFAQGSIVTAKNVTLTGTAPSTGSANLYLGQARDGDTLSVTATYTDPTTGASWQSPVLNVPVSSACQKLEVYSDAGFSRIVGNNPGDENCLSHITNLYFQVQDCQDSPGTLTDAVTVYAIANDGTWVDREYVSLRDWNTNALGSPLYFRSIRALPVVTSMGHVNGDGVLSYPQGKTVQIFAEYRDPYDANDPASRFYQNLGSPVTLPVVKRHDCQKIITLAAPLPICFPNAITSGGSGTWNGNFKVHWGDVVIRGDVQLASQPKFIEKTSGAALDGSRYSGAANSDRFFDIYVGKKLDGSGGNYLDNSGAAIPNANPSALDRPFLPGKEGAGYGTIYGNYYRNVSYPKITEMMSLLDYDTMKSLAQARGCYWYTLPGGLIRNPTKNLQASLETVLSLSAPGTPNAYYDGKYIFVDTFGMADPGPAIDGAALNALLDANLNNAPTFSLGGIYTEGIIFIAGTVEYRSGGGGANVTIQTPPQLEMHYKQNDLTWAPTEADLPIRPNPAQAARTVTLTDINLNGGIYLKGQVTFSGSPTIYGAVSAERGFAGSGTPEIWYNYNLNQSDRNTTLCVACCSLSLSPSVAELAPGQRLTLNALNPSGALTWSSEDPSIATVDSSGNVTGVSTGTTRIKAADANNCSAWATVTVLPPCNAFAVSPGTANITAGSTQLFTTVNAAPGALIQWSSASPAIATINGSGLASGVTAGTVVITAHDANGICPNADAFLTVTSPACTLALSANAGSVRVGGAASLMANNASGTVTWTSGAPGIASVNPSTGATTTITGLAQGSATITATDAVCSRSATITVTPSCALAFSDNFADNSLNARWANVDIGSPVKAGGSTEAGGVLAVKGGGNDIWGTSDEFHFTYLSGLTATDDFVVTVKVNSVENVDQWTKAGLMVRDNLGADARFVNLIATPIDNNARLQYRSAPGSSGLPGSSAAAVGGNTGLSVPYYLRLAKSGSTFTAYLSTDGVTFSQYGQTTVTLNAEIYVGLAVTAHKNSGLATAEFDNFSLTCP